MTQLDTTAFLSRIDKLLAIQLPTDTEQNQYQTINAALQGSLTLAETLYGPGSHAAQTLSESAKQARGKPTWNPGSTFQVFVWPTIKGVLSGMRGDLESGLVGDLRRRGIGEALADMLTLAKEALSDGATNVAAVLAAAGYEDTIRRMGSTLAAVHDRPDLSKVLMALKAAEVLDGAPYTTAQGYLKFRNDALHADWGKIDQATVSSCIAFVEGQVLKHFA